MQSKKDGEKISCGEKDKRCGREKKVISNEKSQGISIKIKERDTKVYMLVNRTRWHIF